MMFKWIAPLVLSVTALGALPAPAQAQRGDDYRYRRDQDDRWDGRYDRNGRNDRNDRYGRNSERADDLIDHARSIQRRANDLYRRNLLSRSHRDRTVQDVEQVMRRIRQGPGNGSYLADRRGELNDHERRLAQWTHSDRRSRY